MEILYLLDDVCWITLSWLTAIRWCAAIRNVGFYVRYGSSPVNEKIRHQISRTDRPNIGVDSKIPITGFQADGLKKWERKTPPPFPQSCSEKGGETGEGGVGSQKPRRHPHRLRRLHRLFPGHFEKLSVFSQPALSRRREKCHPPHHGPAQNP